jgi:hypothetical protein
MIGGETFISETDNFNEKQQEISIGKGGSGKSIQFS